MILCEIKVGLRWFCLRVIVQEDYGVESGFGPTGMGGRPDDGWDLHMISWGFPETEAVRMSGIMELMMAVAWEGLRGMYSFVVGAEGEKVRRMEPVFL